MRSSILAGAILFTLAYAAAADEPVTRIASGIDPNLQAGQVIYQKAAEQAQAEQAAGAAEEAASGPAA